MTFNFFGHVSSGLGDRPNPFLDVISDSFLFRDWSTLLNTCKLSGGSLICFSTWMFELMIGIVSVSVIFMTVINHTCDLVSKRVPYSCESDNYENLCRAVVKLKNCFPPCSLKSIDPPNPSESAIPAQSSTHATTNGGPNAHLIAEPEYNNDESDSKNDAQGYQNKGRKNSQVSSIMEWFKNVQLTSVISVGVILIATAANVSVS